MVSALHQGMIGLWQSGALARIQNRWVMADLHRGRSDATGEHSISASHVTLACALFLAGICAVILVLVGERHVSSRARLLKIQPT